MPTKSGNYLLKVFLDGDTTKLAFTRRVLVVDKHVDIAASNNATFQYAIISNTSKSAVFGKQIQLKYCKSATANKSCYTAKQPMG